MPIAKIIPVVALAVFVAGCITEYEQEAPDSTAHLTSLPDQNPPKGALSPPPAPPREPVPTGAAQSPVVVESKATPSGPSDSATEDRGTHPSPAGVKTSHPHQAGAKTLPDWKARIISELEKAQAMEAPSHPTTPPQSVAAVPPPPPVVDIDKAVLPGPDARQLAARDAPQATRAGPGERGPAGRGSPRPSETLDPAAPTPKLIPVEGSAPPIVDRSAAQLIGPGDLLSIRVDKIQELTTEGRVNQAGAIVMPVVGPVQVAGLTPSQAQEHITKFLATDYVVNPRVALDVKK